MVLEGILIGAALGIIGQSLAGRRRARAGRCGLPTGHLAPLISRTTPGERRS